MNREKYEEMLVGLADTAIGGGLVVSDAARLAVAVMEALGIKPDDPRTGTSTSNVQVNYWPDICEIDGRWEGNLNDDCTVEWNGLLAHCEAMSDRPEVWYIGVFRGGEAIYHSGESGHPRCDGRTARQFAAEIMVREARIDVLNNLRVEFGLGDTRMRPSEIADAIRERLKQPKHTIGPPPWKMPLRVSNNGCDIYDADAWVVLTCGVKRTHMAETVPWINAAWEALGRP